MENDYNNWAEISAGDGNDNITVGYGYAVIDGGDGNDKVTFKGDANEYTVGRNYDGNTTVTYKATGDVTILKNVENISFGGEDANTGSESTYYEYPISLNSALSDTDGSETLSNITLNNIPQGAVLKDSDNNEISPNANGSYTIQTDDNGNANVTLVSQSEIAQSDISDITASVTSTENMGTPNDTSDDDTSTVIVNENGDLDVSGTINGTTFSLGNNDIDLNFDNINIDASIDVNTIDITQGDHDIQNLSIEDVLNMTGVDNKLTILGDSEDSISLADGWTEVEHTEDGIVYNGSIDNIEDIQLIIDTTSNTNEV